MNQAAATIFLILVTKTEQTPKWEGCPHLAHLMSAGGI
jgi:hypothetical protein